MEVDPMQISPFLYLIPLALIYTVLFWIIIPRISGKWPKIVAAIILIPVAYFLNEYFDAYLPNMLRSISRWFGNAF